MEGLYSLAIKFLLLTLVLALLPVSPFQAFVQYFSQIPFLGAINYFLPIPEMLAVIETWLVAVSVIYGILFVLNHVGALKS